MLAAMAHGDRSSVAWELFVELYQPAIYTWLLKKGLGRHDAEDCIQGVFMSVSRSLASFQPDGKPHSFRRWLQTLIRNELIDWVRKSNRSPRTMELTAVWERIDVALLQQQDWEADIESEYQRSLFYRAAHVVKQEVAANTWQAFWMSQVEGIPTHVIAKKLRMTVGAVYVAKGRVLQRLQREVLKMEEES